MSLPVRLCSTLLLAALALGVPWLPALAGLSNTGPTCERPCIYAIGKFAEEFMAQRAPALAAIPERFDPPAPGGSPPVCPARAGAGPAVFAVMLAPGQVEGFTELTGPANDIGLMQQVMRERGVKPALISTAEGSGATRAGMLSAMSKPLPCLRERDQLILVYSGWGTVYPHEWFDSGEFLPAFCAKALEGAHKDACDAAAADGTAQSFLDVLGEMAQAKVRQWLLTRQPMSNYLPGQRMHVLVGAGSRANGRGSLDVLDGVTAAEISNYVTRVRNAGADIFLIIDTRLAANGDLVALQQQAAAPLGWAVYGDTMLEYGGFPPEQDSGNPRSPVPLFGGGEYAVLYASTPDTEAYEYKQGAGEQMLGALTFRVAEALRANKAVKFRDMTLEIARSFAARNAQAPHMPQEPVFMASNLDLALLAPRGDADRKDGGIEIISPTPKRGAAEVQEETLRVVARYTGGGKARLGIVDGEPVPIDANGQFRAEVADAASKFAVALRVLGANYETLAAAELKLRDKPEEPVIAAPARRLALMIANDAYDDPAFPALKTPFADAQAVADILTGRFGFATEIMADGRPLNLFLRNATKAQIQQVLFELRRRLTGEDQLIVYYAGHGEAEPDLGSYWVPVDGQAGADFTWIDANEITREIKRMNAASILVISDSCYAGGLSRGGTSEATAETARERYLAKASRLKSRQLMASGGEEPVEDGGGGGHSVFAQALIQALQSMPEQTFTASELFEQKVKPAVISAANALSEGQTPGFSRIARAGDEPGAEFVFQASQMP